MGTNCNSVTLICKVTCSHTRDMNHLWSVYTARVHGPCIRVSFWAHVFAGRVHGRRSILPVNTADGWRVPSTRVHGPR